MCNDDNRQNRVSKIDNINLQFSYILMAKLITPFEGFDLIIVAGYTVNAM